MLEALTKLKDELMFFVIIDNACMMDKASWRLFDLIASENDHMILILCIKSNDASTIKPENEQSRLNFKIIDPHAYNFYQERLAP